jgi:dGTPase
MSDTTSDPLTHWKRLLTTKRLGRDHPPGYEDADRDEFERDYDRIVFSSAFRRLKDKTQVFPLSENDFTRTRLTHSIEVSCVGRTLGRKLQRLLEQKGHLASPCRDIATIVATACLAHDIGNPPFGHSGEAAIQAWSQSNIYAGRNEPKFTIGNAQQLCDVQEFEGNAQAIRVVCRLQARRREGGLQLTLPTLGAMMKYPCASMAGNRRRVCESRVECKKFGYFEDETNLIVPALRELGLEEYGPGAFRRHPLAFLVEAADDICYAIVDLEDSVDQHLVSYDDACGVLVPLARRVKDFTDKGYTKDSRVRWLRAYAMHALTNACSKVVEDRYEEFCQGTLGESLIDLSAARQEYENVRRLVRDSAYKHDRVLQIEAAGFQVIGSLLDFFVPALLANSPGPREKKLLKLFPGSHLQGVGEPVECEAALERLSTYQRVLAATDYVSGMTDSFAVNLYQKLSGIRLPR